MGGGRDNRGRREHQVTTGVFTPGCQDGFMSNVKTLVLCLLLLLLLLLVFLLLLLLSVFHSNSEHFLENYT